MCVDANVCLIYTVITHLIDFFENGYNKSLGRLMLDKCQIVYAWEFV